MAKAVRDIDRGYARIIRTLAELKGKEIAVGLQAGDVHKESGMDVARLGAIHEFGATINVEARTQTIYHKISKGGAFAKGGRFVKAKRSNFARDVSIGAHSIVIPARPFVRRTFDEKHGDWHAKAQDQIGQVIDGRKDLPAALATIGNVMERDIKAKIADGPFIPNAPSTIRRKKSARPLIDSGHMRQSVRYVVRRRGSGRLIT